MSAIIVNDPHLADTPPSIRTETYTEDIFAKLWWVADTAFKRKVSAVIFSGDVFHVKTPSRTSHSLVRRMCDYTNWLQDRDIDVLVVPGNHDIRHDRLDTIEQQPLGVLFESGASKLDGELFSMDTHYFGIPWLSDWTAELPAYMERWQNSSARLMVTHAPIVPPGQTRPYFTIDAQDWAEVMGRWGYVAHGHQHDPDGVYPVDGLSVFFANEGALSRGSIHESTLARKPAVTLWDPSKKGVQAFERIEVPHKPAEEVFRLAEHRSEEAKVERLDEFLEQVGKTTLERVSVEMVLADLKSRGVASEVLTEVEECLEAAT